MFEWLTDIITAIIAFIMSLFGMEKSVSFQEPVESPKEPPIAPLEPVELAQ